MPARDLLRLLDSLSPDKLQRGKQFEKICRWYLTNDPVYRGQLKTVWLWDEWPDRWGDDEAGIDLVAEANDGRLWAVQAKAYDPKYSIKKSDVDSFLSESARPEFSYRLLIATTDRIGRIASRTLGNQEKPAGQVLRWDLERSPVRWPERLDALQPKETERYSPRPHQSHAVEDIVAGFTGAARGQLIMACGTGKTLVSLWVREELRAERTLVLVPSLSLLRQTIGEWLQHRRQAFEFLVVCSDDTVRNRDAKTDRLPDLGLPATTDAEGVAMFLRDEGPKVVFATYQSSRVIAEATDECGSGFSLSISDEAHRCTGPESSLFATVLDDHRIPVTKRLFMTATPRYFAGAVRMEGQDLDFRIASMDDESLFGTVLHKLSFAKALEGGLLADYRVLVIGVDDATYRGYADRGHLVTRDGDRVDDARVLAAQIGLAMAMRRYGLSRTITFHSRVDSAQSFRDRLHEVIAWMPEEDRPLGRIWTDHVSGQMSSGERGAKLNYLRDLDSHEKGVLTNARCLSEGVDLPALDCVAFIDPKRSAIDITQALGRVMRKSNDQSKEGSPGTVVVPVFVATDKDPELELEGSVFKPVWDVVRALRAHDEVLAEELDSMRRADGCHSTGRARLPRKIEVDMPKAIGDGFVRAFEAKLVNKTTSSWDFWYGLLQRYVEATGSALVPQDYEQEEGYSLGSWVATQRMAKRAGTLSSDRIGLLDQLGLVWSPHESLWEIGFRAFELYVEENASADVPQKYEDSNGFKLGRWVGVQRITRRSGDLEESRLRRLNAIGMIWGRPKVEWEAGYEAFKRYMEVEGHPMVSPNYREQGGFNLGRWVCAQRRNRQRGTLSNLRVLQLSEIGFEWSAQAARWKQKLKAYREYIEAKGSAWVPKAYTDRNGFKLGMWVAYQRRCWKTNTLDADRTSQLENLGFIWFPSEDDSSPRN